MENTPNLGGVGGDQLMEPSHSGARPFDSLRGSMGPVFTQPAGLNMDQGEPANATGTSEPAPADMSHITVPHVPGTPGKPANGREDNQTNVF